MSLLLWDTLEKINGDYPKWMALYNYNTIMGSRAYNTNVEESDFDFMGFIVPPIEILFPHVKGSIRGFGKQPDSFEQLQIQHLETESFGTVDVTIYSIVKYLQLLMNGNPNIIDSIFTDESKVEFSDDVGKLIKGNRHLFLSEKIYHTFRGMLFSHLARIKSGHIKEGRKSEFDYDTKDAYHCVRLCYEMEEILFSGTLTLGANSGTLRQVRNGEFKKEDIVSYCEKFIDETEIRKEREEIVVPYEPDEKKIKDLLLKCLDWSYGDKWQDQIGFGELGK